MIFPRLVYHRKIHQDKLFQEMNYTRWKIMEDVFIIMVYIIWATSWENLFMPNTNNKGADQPAQSDDTFVVCYSDSNIYTC